MNAVAPRRAGASGIQLSAFALGLWHNFGNTSNREAQGEILRAAFENGITHFDLANNYGPPPGAAEENFGYFLRTLFRSHRDELFIASKAGYRMWDGPNGVGGSRKHMLSSLDQSLRRMRLDYVDVFYSHCEDPSTPLEETMCALATAVRQGKALYVALSRYSATVFCEAVDLLAQMGVKPLLHQLRYSLFDRAIEERVLPTAAESGLGVVAFSCLAQGILTGKYQGVLPEDSRAVRDPRFLKPAAITDEVRRRVEMLSVIARERNQSLGQMALSWVLRDQRVTSVILGVSSPEQLRENLACLDQCMFADEHIKQIDQICSR